MTNAALHVARTGLDEQNTEMQVIANNLANVNTTGFKKDRANFETLAYQQIVAAGAQADAENKYAVGLSLGSVVQMTGTARIDTHGSQIGRANVVTKVTNAHPVCPLLHEQNYNVPRLDQTDHNAL